MSFVYTPAKTLIATGGLNLAEAGADIRAILVMANTTADTEQDAEFVGDITTLDEMDGAGYARVALANQVVTEDAGNNRAEFSCDAFTWAALGAGARQVVGMVLYQHVGVDDASNPVLAYIDTGGFPFAANGCDVTITPSADGLIQIT